MPAPASRIYPVILCGGSGSRLWPLSRQLFPKQFLPLHGERTMLQETVRRLGQGAFEAPLFIANEEHRFIVAEQVRAEASIRIILEPQGRGTAAAACVAALDVRARDADGLILLMPSDHVISDTDAFLEAIGKAAVAAANGALVTFGITPTHAETGYGYIKGGAAMPGSAHCLTVERFVEKPDRTRAEAYLAEGGYLWNSGIFLFQASALLEEMDRLRPDILAAVRAAHDDAQQDRDFCRLDSGAFAACPADSLDCAIMEHTGRSAVVPVSMGWSDVGAWSALWDLGEKDASGNVVRGDVLVDDVHNSYVRSEDGRLTALLGLDDVVVVVADDAVLVAARDRVQDIKGIVERIRAAGRSEHHVHSTVYRPWGSFRSVDQGQRFQVKQITVNAGAKLSLQ
ncbi:MAG: mannose-1-phosphate guanylyltransferase/mannose-6-phosphate isomerase, partial [Rhodospirillaceae bacterium]